jgi:hypothetical protein
MQHALKAIEREREGDRDAEKGGCFLPRAARTNGSVDDQAATETFMSARIMRGAAKFCKSVEPRSGAARNATKLAED